MSQTMDEMRATRYAVGTDGPLDLQACREVFTLTSREAFKTPLDHLLLAFADHCVSGMSYHEVYADEFHLRLRCRELANRYFFTVLVAVPDKFSREAHGISSAAPTSDECDGPLTIEVARERNELVIGAVVNFVRNDKGLQITEKGETELRAGVFKWFETTYHYKIVKMIRDVVSSKTSSDSASLERAAMLGFKIPKVE